MKNCKSLVSSLLLAAVLCSCSIREDRAPCYGDPMLSVGPTELVLDMDDGPVALEISTLSPSAMQWLARKPRPRPMKGEVLKPASSRSGRAVRIFSHI